jgi:hypothetical protein
MKVYVRWRGKEEVGLHAFREELLTHLFGGQNVAVHLHPYLSRGTLLAKYVQLPFRSLIVSSETE